MEDFDYFHNIATYLVKDVSSKSDKDLHYVLTSNPYFQSLFEPLARHLRFVFLHVAVKIERRSFSEWNELEKLYIHTSMKHLRSELLSDFGGWCKNHRVSPGTPTLKHFEQYIEAIEEHAGV